MVARRLTVTVNVVLYIHIVPVMREDLREGTTVHLAAYGEGDLLIGGRTPSERERAHVTV
jgi:hypothetical protein